MNFRLIWTIGSVTIELYDGFAWAFVGGLAMSFLTLALAIAVGVKAILG